jgi:dipeptidase D
MTTAIQGLTPPLFWKYFAEISKIPRGSKNEKAAAAFVVATAKKLGLEWEQDKCGNVVVRKPASPGRERSASVCLQSHLDMVCEKRPDKKHDFLKDPITLLRKGNFITADGTTLGADNGAGVASNLALMEDKSVTHGPLEFLFTIDEETGLTGANNLQPGFVHSRVLLNLDSEDEGVLYVGCAGGQDSTGTWKLERDAAPAGWLALEVKVGGLRGGHSGADIHKGRGNANKLLNRVVMKLAELGGRLSRVSGGSKRNAIPRDAVALLFFPKAKLDEAKAAVALMNGVLRSELATVEPDLQVTAEAVRARDGKLMKRGLQKKFTQTLSAMPHGVIKMSAEIPGLVETSTNLAVVTTTAKSVIVNTSQRSSIESERAEIADTVRAVFELGGAEVSGSGGYPGWKPNLDSPILKTARSIYKELFGKEPKVEAIHAGLECGIIGDRYPGMDMVSFGPTMEGAHSPDEKIHIDTVEKYWEYLLGILKKVG